MKINSEVTVSNKEIEKIVNDESKSKSAKMKELFMLGLEIKQIAALMKVRYNFVYNVVSNHVNMNNIETVKEVKENKKEKIIEQYLQGKSNKEISINLKTNYNYVFNVIKSYKQETESKAE